MMTVTNNLKSQVTLIIKSGLVFFFGLTHGMGESAESKGTTVLPINKYNMVQGSTSMNGVKNNILFTIITQVCNFYRAMCCKRKCLVEMAHFLVSPPHGVFWYGRPFTLFTLGVGGGKRVLGL